MLAKLLFLEAEVTRLLSKIIKAPFVSMSEIRKEIINISPDDPNIIPEARNKRHEEGHHETTYQSEQHIKEAHLRAEEIVELAQREADAIIEQAEKDSEIIKVSASEDGYEEGYRQGLESLENEKNKFKQWAQDERDQIEIERLETIRAIEPEMAELVISMVTNLVGQVVNSKPVILYLIRRGFLSIKTYGSFVIKVSEADFDVVKEHQADLLEGLSDKVTMEVLRDSDLVKNQCIIETEMGNLDCSLNIQLDALTHELQLISDSLKNY